LEPRRAYTACRAPKARLAGEAVCNGERRIRHAWSSRHPKPRPHGGKHENEHPTLLSRPSRHGRPSPSAGAALIRRPASSAACASSARARSWWKSSAAWIHARAALAAGFKNCCMHTGRFRRHAAQRLPPRL